MKKLVICLITILAVFFSACKEKEKPVNYADAFVGNYDVSAEATLNIPILGTYPLSIPASDGVIVKDGDEGDVIITMMGQTVSGFARKDGLHVDPFIVNQEIAGYNLAMTVATPVIAPPVDGVITCTANISASIVLGTVTGTADITAVKK